MDLSLAVKLIVPLLIGLTYFIHSSRQIRALNRRGKDLQQQWIAGDPNLIKKFQRLESLSVQLCKLLRCSIYTLGHSHSATGSEGIKALAHSSKDGKWYLLVDWRDYHIGRDEVTHVELDEKVKKWIGSKWMTVMEYNRDFETELRKEARHLLVFETRIVAVLYTLLDTLSDELEEQITKAEAMVTDTVTDAHREQFCEVVEEHPCKDKNRFDDIDL